MKAKNRYVAVGEVYKLNLFRMALLSALILIPFGANHLAYAANSSQTPIDSVPIPCLKDNDMKSPRFDLLSCNAMLTDSNPNGLKTLINSYFKSYIDCYYSGYAIRVGDKVCKDGVNMNPEGPKNPVCSIADAEGNFQLMDKLNNHLGEFCGIPNGRESHRWETAQKSGIRVQAIKYYRNQVIEDEVKRDRVLKIHPRCQAMAADYLSLLGEMKKSSDEVVGSVNVPIPREYYEGKADPCKKGEGASQQVQDFFNQIPASSVCYLSIARENILGLFSRIAQCEIWTRTDHLELKFVEEEEKAIADMAARCVDEATKYGKKVGEDKQSRSAGEKAGNEKYTRCYQTNILQGLRSFIDQNMPGKFSNE